MKTRSSDPTSIRGARARRGSIAAIAALAAAALMSACGSSASSNGSSSTKTGQTHLNTAHVARAIEKSILSERHVHAKVTCPKAVPQQTGRNFACIATTGKARTPFAVTQQNNGGYVTYRAE